MLLFLEHKFQEKSKRFYLQEEQTLCFFAYAMHLGVSAIDMLDFITFIFENVLQIISLILQFNDI
ncbi:hypothetical protein B4W74_07650 [Staphylococcus intermedius]|nr:hypothetical protein B5C04_07300 [Staphylococcus intermedius]PNZ55511.1 hypothetical protein CD138_00205 [Staphylococcus intermedius NCTC 11048]PCF78493.1 hypothetical protein B4W74_07650 [Staphylococcus intermedius]PCF79466.1 hypothetical protein B4W70_07290 [Staphylococcus intermedius]PCF86797.1 hypothetical protein B4W76_07015 [Staphylococcus intermedius]